LGFYIPIRDFGAVFDVAVKTPEINNPYHRPYPSAGARYPVEVYLIAIRIESVPPGVYHYDSHAHCLTRLIEQNLSTGLEEIVGDHDMTCPSFVVILTAVFHRSMIKYAGRGYRYALFEPGGIAQTLELVSRSRGLDVVWLGGFPDQEVAKLLDLNWEMEMEAPVLLLAIGKGLSPADTEQTRLGHFVT
jgi:SagB-type dehydrogenase family enzyme